MAVLDLVDTTRQVAGVAMRSRAEGAGTPVVVLHPSFGNRWNALHDELARDHAVYSLDLPGFDGTDRPEWARHPRDLAMLVATWLRRLDAGPVALVGFEYSGWVAAELVTMAPEVLASLVLVGSAGLLPKRDDRILDMMLISHSAYVRAAFSTPDAYTRNYGEELPDDLLMQWDLNREMVARTAWKPYFYNRCLPPLLTEVRVPTLLVWGDDDHVMPRSCAERFRELIPASRLEVVPQCGHAVGYEQPEALAALVRAHVQRANQQHETA